MMVSASNNALPFFDFTCKTSEPGKWPPAFMAVKPGIICVVGVMRGVRRPVMSARESQSTSSEET